MVIIGGMLQRNPFYIPPEEFLENFVNAGLVGITHPRQPDMGERIEDPVQETKLLHRCMNDLVSLLALPASGVAVSHRKSFKLFLMYSSVC